MSEPILAAGEPESPLPSKTSIWAAAARALGAREPDPTVRNPDWMAERIIGPRERALVSEQEVLKALDQEYEAAGANLESMGVARALLVRTHLIDQKLAQAVESGTRQVAILGAGFDSRAYRLKELLKHVRVFEVDKPVTQDYKRRRVREIVEQLPSNLTYAPFDFRHEKIGQALLKAGWDASLTTFFIWEGVTMYLTEDAVRETFVWLSAHAVPGSAIVFDYVHATMIAMMGKIPFDTIAEGPQKDAIRRWKRLIENEPWLSGLPAQGEAEYLKSVGWEARDIIAMGGAEAERRYLTRQDGTVFCPLPPGELARPEMYWIAEAIVPL